MGDVIVWRVHSKLNNRVFLLFNRFLSTHGRCCCRRRCTDKKPGRKLKYETKNAHNINVRVK